MEMPKPTMEHKLLQCLVGEWVGAEKIHLSPMGPIEGKAIGRIKNQFALDGFVLFHDYEQERDARSNFHGHGIITWNSGEQCYIMYWFHSSGLPPSFLKGTLINDIMILNTEDTITKVRITWDFQRKGQYTSRIETSQDGEDWSPFVEGIYYRKD
jgi:hypothetical protein